MSVKRMVFYQMFRFICAKNEVKSGNEEQNNSTNSIKIPSSQTSQKMSNKYTLVKPVKPAQPIKDKYIEKMPNVEKTKPNIEAFIRNYNEIEKKVPSDK